MKMTTIVDSLMYFRQQHQQTDILSRHLPALEKDEAYNIQNMLLERELNSGASLVGYKMGGTVTQDSANFKPLYGFILDKNLIAIDSTIAVANFPGGSVMVEGEVGFILGKDFPEGVATLEELKEGIDQVIGGVEFAQALARAPESDPDALTTYHILASGMGQAGTTKGIKGVSATEFDFGNEVVKCYINGELAAEGKSSNIYGTPLNALFWLVNNLSQKGAYLKKGNVVITGSMYQNPTISGPAEVRLEFSTLGEIRFTTY